MDRLSRKIASGSLAVVLGIVVASAGCRSMRNDVPPGKPYSATNGNPPAVGFNSDPHPSTTIGPGLYNNNGPTQGNTMDPTLGAGSGASQGFGASAGNGYGASAGNAPQLGTPTPNGNPYGAPTAGRYGAPGTSQ